MNVDRDQLILEVFNDVHAATAYIEDFGGIVLGSPQWMALRRTLRNLAEVTGGRMPVTPNDYPWPGRGWGPALPRAEHEGDAAYERQATYEADQEDPPCPSG